MRILEELYAAIARHLRKELGLPVHKVVSIYESAFIEHDEPRILVSIFYQDHEGKSLVYEESRDSGLTDLLEEVCY